MHIQPTSVEQILDLRHAVLRPGQPRASAEFEGDHESTALHLAAFEGGRVIGCVSLIERVYGEEGEPAWQLRGMAIDPAHQRRGVGTALLADLEARCAQGPGPHLLWCNARAEAVPFYRKHGWQIASPRFEIPHVGPHHRMTRKVG